MEISTDFHRSIGKRLNRISLEECISNRFNCVEIELIGEIPTDGIGVGRFIGLLADMVY